MFKTINRQSFNFSVDVTNTTKILPPNTELFRAGDVLNVEDLTQNPFGWFALNVIDTIDYATDKDLRYMSEDYINFRKYPTVASYKTTEPLKILIITPELVKQDPNFLENSIKNMKRYSYYETDMNDIIKIQNKYKDLDGVAYIGFDNYFENRPWHDEICLFNSNKSIIKLHKSYVWNPLQIKEKHMNDANEYVISLSKEEFNKYERLYSILNFRDYSITPEENFIIFVYIVKSLGLFNKLREESLSILKQNINDEIPDEPIIKKQVIEKIYDFIRKLSSIQIKDFKKIIEKYFK
jgi:hypothetical protein